MAGDSEHRGGSGMLQPYHREASDPDWLVRVGEFHGHLGPWVVIGALAGRDARERLAAGYWDIEVVCWMPPDRQRQPWSCILDGLQVATGASLGKQNIRFAFSPEVVRDGRSVVFVIRRPAGGRPAVGFAYRVNDKLAAMLAGMTPERLEAMSRDIAGRTASELFEIHPLSEAELKL
jgi:formylmethanofuran dehydrogenase subunit E